MTLNKADYSLSIVVPVYKEEGEHCGVSEPESRVFSVQLRAEYEIVSVWTLLRIEPKDLGFFRKATKRILGQLIRFSRRCGKRCDSRSLQLIQYNLRGCDDVMDVVCKTLLSVHEMVQKWQLDLTSVYAQRDTVTGETWIQKSGVRSGYKLITRLPGSKSRQIRGDFRLLSRRVVGTRSIA